MQTLTKQTLKIFWKHSKKYPLAIFGIVFGVLGHTFLQNYTPLLYKKLIDLLSTGSPQNIAPMLSLVKFIFAVAIVRFCFARSFNFINNWFQPRVMADLNNSCFQYLHQHSLGFFSSNFVGSLVTKVKRYERSFETVADQIVFELGRNSLDVALIIVILFTQSPQIAFVALLWAILYLIFSYYYSIYKLPIDIQRAETDTRVTGVLADSITNNFNMKIFASYEVENQNFQKVTEEQFLIRKKSWDLGTWGEVIQAASMIILEFIAMYYAVILWQNGVITLGTIALLQAYFFRIFDKFWNVGRNIRNLYEAIADANEMTEMLIKPHSLQDVKNAKSIKISSGKIEFKQINFGYYKEIEILENFNLNITAGEKIALIGPSGGGKSTIVKLLLRFYDVRKGKILVDSQDISKVTQNSLRSQISLVPQEPILFHRSLLDNIKYAKPSATEEEVINASKLAHAHEFISSFRQGYETLVGERGIKLSGGERQRVAIARAILKNAPILVLDEATSSLDSESEMYIQDALKTLMQNKTVIVIAHRLSTIMQMDRIVVVENGKIAEEGKHKELLKVKEGLYQKLWQIQAGGFS